MCQKALTATRRVRSKIGVVTLDLVVSPVVNDRGERLGSVVEWADVTEQAMAEEEVQQLVHAAAGGQLDTHLDFGKFAGFMQRLAYGINPTLDDGSSAQGEQGGDGELGTRGLEQACGGDFQGQFATLRDAVNR